MATTPTRRHFDGTRDRAWIVRCESQKRGWPTRAAALDAAEDQMRDGRVWPGCHLTPYWCDLCGEWHIANRRIEWRDS